MKTIRTNALIGALILGATAVVAQPMPGGHTGTQPGSEMRGGKQLAGQRKYKLTVNEGNDSTVAEFNRGLESVRSSAGTRGFAANLVNLYKSSAAGLITSLSTNIIDYGLSSLVEAAKSKRPEWQRAVTNESSFTRRLPMQMEILDFYRSPSLNGPLDPSDMNFNGFGCKQVVEYRDADGNIHEEEVFYVTAKVRTDPAGKMRMLNHSKFEVYVDTLRFNYAICDLPNDSLGMNTDDRIGFSFDKRKDLKFKLKADITSSWINQALMVFNDQPLGSFEIEASISPDLIDEDGIFRYYASREEDRKKDVRVSGDCFLVPRSYVGSSDMQNIRDSWGTGQYKIEMQISETCRIDDNYYRNEGKWDSRKWKPEWRKIKHRRHGRGGWSNLLNIVSQQYSDNKWITVLSDPMKTAFLQVEQDGVSKLLNSGTTPTVIPVATQPSQGQSAQGQGQPNPTQGQPNPGKEPGAAPQQ